MATAKCPFCDRDLTVTELSDGWCECGKKIPSFVLKNANDTDRPAKSRPSSPRGEEGAVSEEPSPDREQLLVERSPFFRLAVKISIILLLIPSFSCCLFVGSVLRPPKTEPDITQPNLLEKHKEDQERRREEAREAWFKEREEQEKREVLERREAERQRKIEALKQEELKAKLQEPYIFQPREGSNK